MEIQRFHGFNYSWSIISLDNDIRQVKNNCQNNYKAGLSEFLPKEKKKRGKYDTPVRQLGFAILQQILLQVILAEFLQLFFGKDTFYKVAQLGQKFLPVFYLQYPLVKFSPSLPFTFFQQPVPGGKHALGQYIGKAGNCNRKNYKQNDVGEELFIPQKFNKIAYT
jgi:hypothetical protein